MVLAAGAATFIVLTLLLWLLEKIPPIPERKDLEAVLSMRLCADCSISFLAWMPFFLVFYPGTGMNDTTDIMRAGIWAAGQHTFIYCMAVYGPTELSKELTGSASYGLAFISVVQMFLLACAISYTLPGYTERPAACGFPGDWHFITDSFL